MVLGLCICVSFIICCLVVSGDSSPAKLDTSRQQELRDTPRHIDEAKAVVQRIAQTLAYPDCEKGLEIVKTGRLKPILIRAQLESTSSYLFNLKVAAQTKAAAEAGRRQIDVLSFDAEKAMITYCLDLCRAAQGESSVAESRMYVRRLSKDLGYSRLQIRSLRVGEEHPAKSFPGRDVGEALRKLELCHDLISRQLDKHGMNLAALRMRGNDLPLIGASLTPLELMDQDMYLIRFCRETFRSVFPNEFRAEDPAGAKAREWQEREEVRKLSEDTRDRVRDLWKVK